MYSNVIIILVRFAIEATLTDTIEGLIGLEN